MTLQIITLLLVLIGITGLVISLRPTFKICQIKHDQSRGWKILGALMLFFVAAYLFFAWQVLETQTGVIELVISMVLGGGGIFVALVTRMTMLTIQHMDRIAALERHRALHDDLTDLPNRTLLYERIYYGIMESNRHHNNSYLAVLMMDLDRFKEINDALGHHYGDYLLQLIAPRLEKTIRETDTISRLGGDEFAIVLPGAGLDQAILIAEKITRCMEEPFMIEGRCLKVDISIGIALYPKHGKDGETLLERADVAMYAAKRSSAAYTIYNAKHDEYTLKRLMLTEELRSAIGKDQFFLLYQPIFDVHENSIYCAEALIRWRHPEHDEVISPDGFISLAEQTGLIKPLTYWVVENVLKQLAFWNEQGVKIRVSINLSAKNLYDLEFPAFIKELLDLWGIAPEMLMFEITETSMMSNRERTSKVINSISKLGCNFSIDDFGTGYFPFSSLKQLPAKEIKIDQSFVQGLLRDENDAAIVRATLDLALSLGLKAIAEGIENYQILNMLKSFGCLLGQGYYLCPPLSAEELLDMIKKNKQCQPG